MDFSVLPQYFAVGGLGAASLEVVRLYESYGKLSEKKFKKQFSSKVYWILTILLVAVSGIVAWVFFESRVSSVSAWELFSTGVASRSIIRGILAGKMANHRTLGAKSNSHIEDNLTLKDLVI